MYLHPSRLPHILPPDFYRTQDAHDREMRGVMLSGWHLIGSTADMPRPGDFITQELFGKPLLIRNVDGVYHAYLNVCAHRHCLLTSAACGNSPRLKCQYHGWEYDTEGCTGKIPDPKNFPPFNKAVDRLTKFRAAVCGQLVFVSLAAEGPSLEEHLGPGFAICARETARANWVQTYKLDEVVEANWKVTLENSLEAYHVEHVHSKTFHKWGSEEETRHELAATWTSLEIQQHVATLQMKWSLTAKDYLFRRLGRTPDRTYRHYHFFPTMLYSFTQISGVAFSATPVSPTSSRLCVRVFSIAGENTGIQRPWVALLRRMTTDFVKQVLQEDIAIFPAVQKGLNHSPAPGVLGRIEERIFAFHRYLGEHCWPEALPTNGTVKEPHFDGVAGRINPAETSERRAQ